MIPALNSCWGCNISAWNFLKRRLTAGNNASPLPSRKHRTQQPSSVQPICERAQSDKHLLIARAIRRCCVDWLYSVDHAVCPGKVSLAAVCCAGVTGVLSKSTRCFPKTCTYCTSMRCFCCSYINATDWCFLKKLDWQDQVLLKIKLVMQWICLWFIDHQQLGERGREGVAATQ